MAELTCLLCADMAIEDKQTGKLSLLGIFERLNIKGGVGVASFAVVAKLKNADDVKTAKIEIRDPDKDVLCEVELKGDSNANLNLIGRFNTITFTKEGEYKVKVFANNSELNPLSPYKLLVKND